MDLPNASFSRAFYFTSTVFLSIGVPGRFSLFLFLRYDRGWAGYGDVVPCTITGKLLTMLYASTGVPLAVFCLRFLHLLCVTQAQAIPLCSRLGRPIRAALETLWFRCRPLRPGAKRVRGSCEWLGGPGGCWVEVLPLKVGVGLTLGWVAVSAAAFLFLVGPDADQWAWGDTRLAYVPTSFDYLPARETGNGSLSRRAGPCDTSTLFTLQSSACLQSVSHSPTPLLGGKNDW